jgi:hypothetical protein
MNKNNFAILILVVVVIAGASYAIGNALLGSKSFKPVTVETATPIAPEVTQPEPTVFSSDAINPTVPISIGDTSNQNPLGD